MMDNDPEKTLSQKGSDVRKKIRPFFTTFLKLGNKLKLVVEKNETKKIERPIIYVACHGFKDDVLNTILTLKDDAYVVFGNIDLFFHTFDGLCLWIYGTQLVNRYDKKSKNAMKNKMSKIIDLGNNIIIFSEATWNLSPNKLMENLHWGFYDVAIDKNAVIVPVLTHKVGKKCYSRVLKPVDPTEITQEDLEHIVHIMHKYVNKAIDLNIYNDVIFKKLNECLLKLKSKIDSLDLDNFDESLSAIKNIEEFSKNVLQEFNSVDLNIEDEIKLSAFSLIKKLLFRISCSTKEAIVCKIRNLMASEKFDLIEKHPDHTYEKDNKDIYEAWEDYIDETIKATPYFYPEQEKTTLYLDPLIQDETDVMPWLNQKKLVKIQKKSKS